MRTQLQGPHLCYLLCPHSRPVRRVTTPTLQTQKLIWSSLSRRLDSPEMTQPLSGRAWTRTEAAWTRGQALNCLSLDPQHLQKRIPRPKCPLLRNG